MHVHLNTCSYSRDRITDTRTCAYLANAAMKIIRVLALVCSKRDRHRAVSDRSSCEGVEKALTVSHYLVFALPEARQRHWRCVQKEDHPHSLYLRLRSSFLSLPGSLPLSLTHILYYTTVGHKMQAVSTLVVEYMEPFLTLWVTMGCIVRCGVSAAQPGPIITPLYRLSISCRSCLQALCTTASVDIALCR